MIGISPYYTVCVHNVYTHTHSLTLSEKDIHDLLMISAVDALLLPLVQCNIYPHFWCACTLA